MRIVKELLKKEVINPEGKIIGKVQDVDFDEDTLEITDLIVKKSGLSESLKSSNGENVVPIELVKAIGDKILLTK